METDIENTTIPIPQEAFEIVEGYQRHLSFEACRNAKGAEIPIAVKTILLCPNLLTSTEFAQRHRSNRWGIILVSRITVDGNKFTSARGQSGFVLFAKILPNRVGLRGNQTIYAYQVTQQDVFILDNLIPRSSSIQHYNGSYISIHDVTRPAFIPAIAGNVLRVRIRERYPIASR